MFSVAPLVRTAPVQSADAYHFMLYNSAVAGFARARRRVAVVFMMIVSVALGEGGGKRRGGGQRSTSVSSQTSVYSTAIR